MQLELQQLVDVQLNLADKGVKEQALMGTADIATQTLSIWTQRIHVSS